MGGLGGDRPYDASGVQDTVPLLPNQDVVIRTRFTDFPGKFVFHCHILDHEDNGDDGRRRGGGIAHGGQAFALGMPRSIAVTFDYLCPFARNAHEAVVAALRDGSDLDIRFLAFSLNQSHVEEGQPAVWEATPDEVARGVRALSYGLAVRDEFPESFLDFHLAAFAARHDSGQKFDAEVLDGVVASVGLDVEAVRKVVETGRPLETLAAEHEEAVSRWSVFGVPTFIEADEAVFIRFMERGRVDDLERALDLLGWTRLNEFKRTRIPR